MVKCSVAKCEQQQDSHLCRFTGLGCKSKTVFKSHVYHRNHEQEFHTLSHTLSFDSGGNHLLFFRLTLNDLTQT